MLTDRSRIARSLCSSLAIATALVVGASAAHAQTAPSGSFQGNGTFASGSGTITTGTGTTTINLATNDAVIDWTTFDTAIGGGPINFQPSGTTATFQRTSDFSVLNRILPTDPSRAVQFNGNVIAQIQGTTTTPGGSVYFYSPGGVIVGATAVFNVGNLGLTSAAPQVVGGVFETGLAPRKTVTFQAANPGTAVIIQAGAQINVQNNSYLAVVAPLVTNAGTINIDGVAVLVSADAATITFDQNSLFDIQVTSGTSSTGTAGNGRTLINTGTITGSARSGTGPLRRVYLVAVPKNDAITMVIGNGSSLGFNIAGAADVLGNAVVLSAGHDIAGGQIVAAPSAGGGSGTVMIDSFNAGYTSEVVASATGRALFASDGTVGAGNTSFAANLTAHSATIASLEARSGGSANVTGNLALDANAFAATPTSSVVAGNAYIDSRNGASLTVGGNAVLVARAQGGNATGGNASATAITNGTINVGGVLRVRAEGLGGNGGAGTGGTAVVNAQTGGDIFADQLNLTAEGTGGDDVGAGAGNGRGGNISLIANGAGSTISIANGNSTGTGRDLFFSAARGFGGQSNGGGSGVGGSAFGGNVSISATNGATLNGPATVGPQGFVRVFARAFAGDANTGASAGGAATGGNINITVDNATFTSAELLPSSFAQAGSALPTATGTINGGNAVGGTRNIAVRNGATMTTAFSGGGPGAQGGNATLSGRGGDASGGSASLVVDNATLTLTGRATVFSQNMAGSGGTTGNVTAGTAFGQVSNGAVVNVFNDTASANDDFSINANAFGALSPATPGTAQGTVTAGTATLLVQGGTIQGAGTVGVGAGAFAQSDQYAQGGVYRGGTANLQVQGGTISVAQIRVTANANAAAVGAGLSGTGGSATGGHASLQLNGGTLSGSGLEVNAEAFGGAIGTTGSGNGGVGTGGFSAIDANAGTNSLSFNAINLFAGGTGGNVSGAAGIAGTGQGNLTQIVVSGGATLTVNAPTVTLDANGVGGNNLAAGGSGGDGAAGRSNIIIDGGTATFNGDLALSGDAAGGDGVNGGAAFSAPTNGISRALLQARNGSLTVTGLTKLSASAQGGDGSLGGNGGNATGGLALAQAINNANTVGNGTISLGDLVIDSTAAGGNASGTGNGGNAGAGLARLFVDGGSVAVSRGATIVGAAFGGNGINGGNAISARPFRQPRALIGSFNGTISVAGATVLDSSASGGDGSAGGAGGIAFAGVAAVDAQSNNGPSAINLADLLIAASAAGGFGGAGGPGLTGGAGGDAYGGIAVATGNAGQGDLTVSGDTIIDVSSLGGFGGLGGSGGTTAPGSAGGAGGRAIGGAITVGTASGVDTPSNTGSATFGLVSGNASGLGGAGGDGGTGTTAGNGGAGATGFGGSAGLLARGSPATFTNVSLSANGIGGDGGKGSVQGDGGDGYAGGGFVIATQRFMRTERGSLTANNVNITSAGIGGVGVTAGDSFYSAAPGAESDFFIRQSTVTLANLTLGTSGALAPNLTTTILTVVDPTVSGIPVPTSITVTAEPFDLEMADSTASIAGNFTLSTPGNMRVLLGNSTLNVGNLTLSAGNFVLPASAPAVVGTINVSNSLALSTQRDFRIYANLVSAAPITISALTGAVATGNLQATGDVDITAGLGIATGAVMASQRIHLDAGGTITTGALVAGDAVNASAGGALSVASASAGIVNPSTNAFVDYVVTLRSLVSVNAGNLSAQRYIGLGSLGAITVGNLSAGLGVLALAGTGLTTGSIATGLSGTPADPFAGVYLANFSMEPLGGGQIGRHFDPAPILALPPVAIGGPISITGAITTAGVRAAATGAIATQAITVAQSIDISGGAAITAGQLTAGDTVEVDSVGALNVAGASAGIVNPSTDPFASYNVGLRSLTSVVVGNVSAKANFGVSSPGSIAVGNVSVGQAFLALPGTSLTTGSITTSQTGGRVYIANNSMEALGGQIAGVFNPAPILAAAPVAINGPIAINGAVTAGTLQANATGTLAIGGPVAVGNFTSLSGQAGLTTGAITAGQSIFVLSSNGAIGTGALQAGDRIEALGMGALTFGNVSAGLVQPSTSPSALYRVVLESRGGSVTTGTISARRDVGIQAVQAITTGNIAGRDILLLPGSSLTTGSIQALNGTQPTGRVYISNPSLTSTTNGFVSSIYTNLPIFNLGPVRTGGSITIGGAVTAGSFFAATGQAISVQSITAGTATSQGVIDIDVFGLATVDGRLTAARKIVIASGDIDITATGSLDALGPLGEVQLASNVGTGAFIGDGLTGSGYMLSNAEFSRLKAGTISILADDKPSLTTDMTIGNLSIAASQLYGSDGVVIFATGDRFARTSSGTLRIAGAVTGTGFAATNEIDLLAGTVEIEAEKGSLKVDNGSGGLGGQIVFQADHIHIASDAILAKLRADPFYEGHIKELNAPALVQRTDGVLNALNLDFSSKSRTVYVQNTGSIAVPAGIVTRLDNNTSSSNNNNNNTSNEGVRPPGGSEFVINGQIQTNTGLATGKAAFDLVIASLKAEALADGKTFASDLTPTSTLNGCVIVTGVCAFGQSDPVAAISSEIKLVTNATLDESPVAPAADDSDEGDDGSSDKKDEDDSTDEGSSPIAPPTPLISTRALDGDVNVVEPVSGAGNPALFGSAVNETTVQGEKP